MLGAAAERDIPVVPRRSSVVPGPGSPEDDDAYEDEDDTPAGGTAAAGIPAVGRRRTTTSPGTRRDPRPDGRSSVRLLVGLAILLVAAAGLGAGYAWTRTQYFVGAAGDQVAIYQGLPDGIPGLQLAQVYEVQDLPVASLPPYYQGQVTAGIEVASVEAARVTVEELREMARRCAQPTPSPEPTHHRDPRPPRHPRPPPTGSRPERRRPRPPRPR